MKIILYILLIISFLFTFVNSKEKNYFLNLKYNKVNVRYGPDLSSPIKYVYKKKNLPVKIIDKKENFRKIIDLKKNSGWIHWMLLKPSNSIIILEDKILFKKPSNFSKPIARLEKGRLLVIKKCKKIWCKVKTADYTGWLETNNVWGKVN